MMVCDVGHLGNWPLATGPVEESLRFSKIIDPTEVDQVLGSWHAGVMKMANPV